MFNTSKGGQGVGCPRYQVHKPMTACISTLLGHYKRWPGEEEGVTFKIFSSRYSSMDADQSKEKPAVNHRAGLAGVHWENAGLWGRAQAKAGLCSPLTRPALPLASHSSKSCGDPPWRPSGTRSCLLLYIRMHVLGKPSQRYCLKEH